MAKMICEFQGQPVIWSAADNINIIALALRNMPGVGNPFLYFAALPPGSLASVNYGLHTDWAGHGNVVNADPVKNLEMLEAMLADPPLDAVTIV